MKSTSETNVVISMSRAEVETLYSVLSREAIASDVVNELRSELKKHCRLATIKPDLYKSDLVDSLEQHMISKFKPFAELRFDYVSETGERTYRILTVTSIKKNHFRPVAFTLPTHYNPIERITGYEERVKGFRTFKWERMTNVLLLKAEKNLLRNVVKRAVDFNDDPMVLPALIQSINPDVKIEY